MSERYTHGYGAASSYYASRIAKVDAAFLLPHLQPGMSVLDCGCGVGSITVGIAEAVAPGTVVGIDVSESQIRRAEQAAGERGTTNASFAVGDVYSLKLPDEAFDVVFMNALLEHLSEPERAVMEAKRVLRTGGILAVRHSDMVNRYSPHRDNLVKSAEARLQMWKSNGGDPFFGRKQTQMLLSCGFEQPVVSSSTSVMSGAVAAELMPPYIAEAEEQLTSRGFATTDQVKGWISEYQEWGSLPGAYKVMAVWWETVARKAR